MSKKQFRFADKKDVSKVLYFIHELAEYENLRHEVVATEELIHEWLFEKEKAEVIFAMDGEKEVGFALFFHNYSTFLGRGGIYLEDLYVLPEYRKCGYGKALIQKLASIAVERDCGRLEWCCLDWNKPSLDFYLSLGAKKMEEWRVLRVEGNLLQELGLGI